MSSTVAVPGYVHSVTAPRGGSIVLDGRSGRCYLMNGTAHELWREWRRTGDFDTALSAMADRNPVHASDRFRADSRQLADMLLARGLLVTADATRTDPGGDTPTLSVDTATPRFRFVAALAFPATLLLVRLPFRASVRVLSWLRAHWCRRGATAAQALAALLAVEAVARYYPGRFACLEQSLGAAFAMALSRRHLSLVIGVADDPCRFHAWVATQDGPVSYPPDSDLTEFRPIMVV